MDSPTVEQEKIIEHHSGEAVVNAVAGSGKTSTLIRRSINLQKKCNVPAERILLTTFSRAAKAHLGERGAQLGMRGVEIKTVHSLANLVIEIARTLGLAEFSTALEPQKRQLFEEGRQMVLAATDPSDRRRRADLKRMTYRGFYDYLSRQKGDLTLPYWPDELPPEARALIKPVDVDMDMFAALYVQHDELRRDRRLIDLDDMIVVAWTLLHMFPHLLQEIRNRFDHVMVDEFQDLSLVQSELMQLVAATAHSYMVVGDEDQTVFQWRGANPRRILDFANKEGVDQFKLTYNFRSPFDVVTLSDRVIRENRLRIVKSPVATQKRTGLYLHQPQVEVVSVIQEALRKGRKPEDIVILLRTYAQSAKIEQGLLENRIPYRLVGNLPFYLREDACIIFDYIHLAMADFDIICNRFISSDRRKDLMISFRNIINVPKRYLNNTHLAQVKMTAWVDGHTLVDSLLKSYPDWPEYVRPLVHRLAEGLSYLTDHLGSVPGKPVLLGFTDAVGYEQHLLDSTPAPEYGQERVSVIAAVAELAQTCSLGELHAHIENLCEVAQHQERLQDAPDSTCQRITIMTVLRAKGAEFPVVVVPDCTGSLYSPGKSGDIAADEEARRIFYVALTRTLDELHLMAGTGDVTPFLKDADVERLANDHQHLDSLLSARQAWTAAETLTVARLLDEYGHVGQLHYLLPEDQRRALTAHVHSLIQALKAAKIDVPDCLFRIALLADGGDDIHFPDLYEVSTVLTASLNPAASGQSQLANDAKPDPALARGTRVRHAVHGDGTVLGVEVTTRGTTVRVQFAESQRRLALTYTRLEVIA